MDNISFDEIESKYSELAELNNSKKSSVYLVQNQLDGRIYIKKELKNYNIDVYRQIIKINNIHMARIYEIFKCEDTLVVIEEFINGQTLQSIIDNKGPLEEVVAINYVINLCSILDILHKQEPPVIHRDIKPSNIIIDNNYILKLIDFDVSRVYNDEKNMDTHILGTKGYASPEQFGFDQTDCRSDIYSVGILLNVLTTGKHVKEKLNEGKLKSIIEKCTNISPEQRYSSVKELKEALKDVIKPKNYEYNSYEKDKYKHKINNKKKEINLEKKVKEKNIKEEVNKKYEKKNYNNKIKKPIPIIGHIPGFRTKKIIKMLVAIYWYAFLCYGLTSNWSSGNKNLILQDFSMASGLLLMTLFNCNFKDIKNKLPMVKSKDKGKVIAGIILYNLGMIMISGFLLNLFEIS